MTTYPQRKSPRLQGYDYSQDGAYFVTICTHDRLHHFGSVIDADMYLNTLGCIAQTCWELIPAHFPHIELDADVVMPNHVHGIVVMNADTIYRVPTNPTVDTFSKPRAGSLASVIRSYKAAVTRQVNRTLGTDGSLIWQGRYHDHIIRSEAALNKIRDYVLHNPARWHDDTFFS